METAHGHFKIEWTQLLVISGIRKYTQMPIERTKTESREFESLGTQRWDKEGKEGMEQVKRRNKREFPGGPVV